MWRLLDDVAAFGRALLAIAILFLLVCVILAPVLQALGIEIPN
jgi:hypothetical protein